MIKAITISDLARIMTARKAEELAGQEFYIITERGNFIIGKIRFEGIDIESITLNKVYKKYVRRQDKK